MTAIVQGQLKLYRQLKELKSGEESIEANKEMKIWDQTMYLYVLQIDGTFSEATQICQNRLGSQFVCGLLSFLYQIMVNIVKMCHFPSCLIHAIQIMVVPGHVACMTAIGWNWL